MTGPDTLNEVALIAESIEPEEIFGSVGGWKRPPRQEPSASTKSHMRRSRPSEAGAEVEAGLAWNAVVEAGGRTHSDLPPALSRQTINHFRAQSSI